MSDRFGSRTGVNFVARLLCSPAFIGPASTSTTTTSSVPTGTVTTTTLPPGTDQALVCQRSIESGGIDYATEMIDAVAGLRRFQRRLAVDVLAGAGVAQRLQNARSQWHALADPQCASLNVRTKLGYAEKCGAAPSLCTAPVTDAQSVVDCLACRFQESVKAAGTLFYANQTTNHTYEGCSQALGNGTLGLVEDTLQNVHTCVQQPGQRSIASCFAPGTTAWRPQVESACMSVNPFTQMSYPQTCPGASRGTRLVRFHGSAMHHERGRVYGSTADNDLLDCFGCRAEEAVLQVARDMYGSNLCCIGGVCNKVLTRFSCREAGGTPVRYHIESLPITVAGTARARHRPRRVAAGRRLRHGRVLRVAPNNTVTVLGTRSASPSASPATPPATCSS